MPEPGNNVVTNMMDVLENKQDSDSAEKPPGFVAVPSIEAESDAQNSVAAGETGAVVENNATDIEQTFPDPAPLQPSTESNVITAPSKHVAEPKMEAVVGGGSTPLGTAAPEKEVVVEIRKDVIPYTGPFKECDSIKLTPAGVVKPDYCCDNAQQGLLHYAAVYTIVHADGTTEDVCAQCATHYETSSEA